MKEQCWKVHKLNISEYFVWAQIARPFPQCYVAREHRNHYQHFSFCEAISLGQISIEVFQILKAEQRMLTRSQ